MARLLMAFTVVWLAVCAAASGDVRAEGRQQPATAPSGSSPAAAHHATLNRYCVSCHNGKLKTAGLMLDALDVSSVGAEPQVWEKVVRKLRAGMMPPLGRPRPDKATSHALVSWLEEELDRAAATHLNPGRPDAVRRLNRTEYRNTIRDLLGLDLDVSDLLPADDSSSGFDNVSLGGLDPGRLEAYLTAAKRVSRLAVGSPGSPIADTVAILPSDLRQDDHIEGLPFGTRGGAAVSYNFPVDAEYSVKVTLGRDFLQLGAQEVAALTEPHDMVLTLDGVLVHRFSLAPQQTSRPAGGEGGERRYSAGKQRNADADLNVTLPVTAGPRVIGAAFLSKGSKLVEQNPAAVHEVVHHAGRGRTDAAGSVFDHRDGSAQSE
jgi:mono/diheme cytochrome c family protein